MRILVVDDEIVTVEALRYTLEDAGHEVVTAENGRAALEELDRELCQLVITDWDMPELDGLALCRKLRETDSMDYIYVILLTSYREKQKIVEGISAGADDFISKPFDPDELLVRIRAGERMIRAQMQGVTIFALAKLAESRDPETGEHLERVRNYTKALSQYLLRNRIYSEVDAGFVQLMYETSPLHDVGKVAIPDKILQKPGRLTQDEFVVMQHHTIAGALTLGTVLQKFPEAGFLEMARDIAVSHHERFDGHGYPAEIAGDAIPLCGRIMAIADVYDALTSKRVYKPAFSHEQASSIMIEEKGRQFDPLLIDAFLEIQDEFTEIRESFSDGYSSRAIRLSQ